MQSAEFGAAMGTCVSWLKLLGSGNRQGAQLFTGQMEADNGERFSCSESTHPSIGAPLMSVAPLWPASAA
jgi:hypothetical protein